MLNNKFFLVSSEIELRNGGIQSWAFYIRKFLKEKSLLIGYFRIRPFSWKNLFNLIKANFRNIDFILMDWQKFIFIFPSLFLNLIGLNKSKYFIFILGDEILNLNFFKKTILKFLIQINKIFWIPDSTPIGEIFKKTFSHSYDFVCYPFVKTQTSQSMLSHTKKNTNEKFFFTVTRLVERKNVASVINALAELRKRGMNFKYYIGGSGPQFDHLLKQVRDLELQEYVFLLGKISEKAKAEYLSRADLFLLPSLYVEQKGSIEGYGIVFIEANAYGVPVISGNTGGIVEAVIDGITGFHTDGTVNDIAEKIEKALNFSFDREKIVLHALKHDYRNQQDFLDFLSKD